MGQPRISRWVPTAALSGFLILLLGLPVAAFRVAPHLVVLGCARLGWVLLG